MLSRYKNSILVKTHVYISMYKATPKIMVGTKDS